MPKNEMTVLNLWPEEFPPCPGSHGAVSQPVVSNILPSGYLTQLWKMIHLAIIHNDLTIQYDFHII